MFYLLLEQGLPFHPSPLKESPGPPQVHCLLFKTGLYFLGLSELFVLFCFLCIRKTSLNKSPRGRGPYESNLKLNPGMKWHLKLNYVFVYRKVDWLNALGLPRFPCVAKRIFKKYCGCVTSVCSRLLVSSLVCQERPPRPPAASAAPLTSSAPVVIGDPPAPSPPRSK